MEIQEKYMEPMLKNKQYRVEFFENSDMLISIYDRHLNLVDANKAFYEALGLKKEDTLGKNINVISPDCKPSGRYTIYQNIVENGGTYEIDQLKLHPKLGGIYVRLRAFQVGDGLCIASKEITDLVETIDDLETFIYKASHDVRSPITTALGLINVAQYELKDSSKALHYLNMIKQQTELMDKVVSSLVETTRIRHGDVKHEPINFEEVLNKVIYNYPSPEGMSQVKIDKYVDVEGSFNTDKTLLSTIFTNLIQNAVHYRDRSKKNPFVKIKIVSEGRGVRINVEDNGMGMNEEAQRHVFKMFFKGSSISEGSGLGLYTVKRCVKKLGGHIAMESKVKTGTVFSIYLPNGTLTN